MSQKRPKGRSMNDLTLKATLRADEQCDPPMFNAVGGENTGK